MNPEPTPPGGEAGLQFDKAEFKAGSEPACALCKTPIKGEYYQANGQMVCPPCRNRIQSDLGGSDQLAIFRSLAAGLVAAIGGFLLYWVVALITHAHWGIIAIAVGWMVGSAVRWGSKGVGGGPFQIIAMILTYLAIVASYVPAIMSDNGGDFIGALRFAIEIPWKGGLGILSILIMGFGVYEAWSLNRKVTLAITGPFQTVRAS